MDQNCKNCGGPKKDVCPYCGTGTPDPKTGVTPVIVRG